MKTLGGDEPTDGKIGPGRGIHVWVLQKGCEPKKGEKVAVEEDPAAKLARLAKLEALLKPKEYVPYRPGTYMHTGYQSTTSFNDFGPTLFIVFSLCFCCCYMWIQRIKKEMMSPAPPPKPVEPIDT